MSKRQNALLLDEKQKIIEAAEQNSNKNAKRARLKTAKHEDLDKAVLTWHKTVMSHPDVTVSGELLMEKAKEFADHLGIDDFKASDGWLENFKRRNSITFGKRHGEAADVDLVALGTWQANVYKHKCMRGPKTA
ncbi:tc5 transposase DNA-binding domain-containing protein [Ditylenchus destructor]|nr:tc5 transposase DNA-binding domain-containing protein [Ditylenchus destructor]